MPSQLKQIKLKTQGHSAAQLEALRKPMTGNRASQNKPSNSIGSDVRSLGKNVLTDMVIELAEPLNPILSWFGESNHSLRGHITSSEQPQASFIRNPQKIASVQPKGLCNIPLKSPPCKRCPAISGGSCKCAVKALNA